MHKVYQSFIFLLSIFFFTDVLADSMLNQQLQAVTDKDRIKYHIVGLSVSIKLPGQEIQNFVSGHTSQSKIKKITPNTFFQIGSIGKTFTATLIMQLVEQNKLHLNDKLGKFLPRYPKWKDVTIRNLLNHTSGIYNFTHPHSYDVMLRKNPYKKYSMIDLANMAYQYPNHFKPGQGVNYSNTDYILLGLVIEKVTHKPMQLIFDDYLHKYNLMHTFYTPYDLFSNSIKKNFAHGYDEEGTFGVNKDATFFTAASAHTAGSMISTPNDLVKWLIQLFNEKIISHHSLETMMTLISDKTAKPLDKNLCMQKKEFIKNPMTEIGSGLGMGLIYFRQYGFVWAHAGGVPNGYESFYSYNPCKDIYVAVIYNKKPKKQLIFTEIEKDIFKVILKSSSVQQAISSYQQGHPLPSYCQCEM